MLARHMRILISLITVGLWSIPAGAVTYNWNNPGGGVFTKPDNWNPSGVPVTGDLAVFDLDSATYNVEVPTGEYTTGKLQFKSGNVTLDIAGTLTATGDNGDVFFGWSADEVGNVTFTGGGVLNSSSLLAIGPYIGTTGVFTVANGTVNSMEFDVGHKGTGTLLLQSDGIINSGQVIIASYSNSVGDATVDGGEWNYSGNFSVGWDGVGTLTARNGATINETATGKMVYIGRTGTGRGNVLIEGVGTTWNANAGIRVGNAGVGELTVRDGAAVSGKNVSLGCAATGSGTVCVDNGQLVVDGDLSVGGTTSAAAGSGTMTVRNGGTVQVDGATKLWGDGLLRVQSGTLSTGSLNAMNGTLAWTGGTIEVTGAGGLDIGPNGDIATVSLTAGKNLTATNAVNVAAGGALSLAGGSLTCGQLDLDGGTVTTTSTLNLDNVGTLTGYGYVNGCLSGGVSASISANGAMTLGAPDSTAGYNVNGTLAVGSHQVTLLDSNRALLGHTTTIDTGGVLTGLNGLRLDAGEVLTATGAAMLRGEVLNDGTVHGPTGALESLVFNDDVLGNGSYTGNIEFRQGFMPGNSPGSVSFGDGDVCFAENATLVMEILGTASMQYDRLLDIGTLDFQGDLQLIFGFTPEIADTFELLDFTSFSGSFDNIEVIGLDPSMLNTSQLTTMGRIEIIPEPTCISLLALGSLAMLRRRRCRTQPVVGLPSRPHCLLGD